MKTPPTARQLREAIRFAHRGRFDAFRESLLKYEDIHRDMVPPSQVTVEDLDAIEREVEYVIRLLSAYESMRTHNKLGQPFQFPNKLPSLRNNASPNGSRLA